MRAVFLVSWGFAGGVCGAATAFADGPAAPSALASSRPARPFSDQGGDVGDFSGYRLSAPLRLSLEGSLFPVGDLFPNCQSRGEEVGNSVGRIPIQRYTEVRFTSRLVLSGFTRLGCPIDAGMGGALAYAVPVRESMRVVFGVAVYGAPGQLPLFGGAQTSFLMGLRSESAPINESARVDLVWKSSSRHVYNLGVEGIGAGQPPGVRFGGGF